MHELIGQSLGKYRITEIIGQGGMATVFKARQQGLERWVAVKVLPPAYAADPDFSRYFLREAQAIAQLEHPHILPVYDFGQQGDYTYLVMRYIRNSWSLADVMNGPIPFSQALEYLRQTATALDHAHRRGIIHRDVKPANILLDDAWVLLADFGLARMMQASAAYTTTSIDSGTPAYMSPEQGSGRQVDAATDIYALGVITYLMFTGEIPHLADSSHAIIYRRNHEPAPSLRTVRPELPLPVDQCVQRALAPNPDSRYPRAGEFVKDLGQAIQKSDAMQLQTNPLRPFHFIPAHDPSPPTVRRAAFESSPPPGQPAQDGPKSTTGRRMWWLLAALVTAFLVVVVMAGAIWLMLRGTNDAPATGGLGGPVSTAATGAAGGASLYFEDDFSQVGLDQSVWRSVVGGGQVLIFDGVLRLTSSGQTFPLVYTTANPFPPEGPFRVKIILQYLSAEARGAGFALGRLPASFTLRQDQAAFLESQQLGLWQDSDSWRVIVGPQSEAVFGRPAPKLARNELEIDFIDNVYGVKLNGELIYVSQPVVERPTHLWFGSPLRAETGGDWSGLAVERVSVERLPDSIAALSTATLPTATPSPVPSPTASPTPTVTPTPLGQNCSTSPGEAFAGVWTDYRHLIGCPVNELTVISTIAEQLFQGGHMFWRRDTEEVYVVYDRERNGTDLFEGEWELVDPELRWDGSNPDGIGLSPPPGLVEPRRGFGWLWRNHLAAESGRLGWALDKEYGFDNLGLAQRFEEGLIFKGSAPKIYVLLDDGTFYAR